MAQDTPEKSILEKLAQTQTFHPAGAKLFVPDWTLDPGDVVTVTSKKDVHDPDEEPTEYRVPIYSMDLTWNGTSRLDIQSTGNQEREPLSALRRKEYQTGRRGYGMAKELDDSFKEFETWQTQTDETIGTYAAQFVDILGDGTNEGRLTLAETAIEQTASDATITAQAAGILLDEDGHPILDERGKYQYDPNAADTTLIAQINTNATEILAKVSQSDLNTTLSSYLQINAFSTELASTLDNGDTTLAAKIITAVNKNTNTSSVVISADQINLDGVVTAVFLDSRMAKIDQLFTEVGYAGAIAANSASIATSLTAGSVYADSFYFKGETSGSDLQVVTKPVYLMGDGNFINGLSLLATGASDMNIRHSHAISIEAMSGADEGKIQVTLGEAVVTNSTDRIKNFNIADTAFYKKRVGISSVDPGNWQYDSTEHKYYNPVVATAKDSTQANPDTMTANVFIPDITLTPVVNGMTYIGKVNAWGPSVSGTVYAAADELSLYLKEKDNYVYITKTDSDPVTVGPNSNVVARMEIQGGGSEEDYNQGYADGQTNARAEISGIILNRTYTSYSDNNLSVKISATPKLVLLSNDDPPVETERTGDRLTVDETMIVKVTDAELSSEFVNGKYIITGTGGNVNVDSVDGEGGANIPVGVEALIFTPTEAIESVSAKLKGVTTQSTYTPLEPGDYGLYKTVDGTEESTAIEYFRVSSGGTSSVKYVVSSSGEPITIWNGLSIVGNLYPNTDVITGGTDQLNRTQVTYRGRTGYVGSSYISTTKGATNYIGRIGWTDEGSDASRREVSSLSTVILSASDTGTSNHNVNVTYDDGTVVQNGATVTVDASAIAGGGGGAGGVIDVTKYQESDDSTDWGDWDEWLNQKIALNSDGQYAYLKVNARDGSTYHLGINASAVYQQGRTDGSGQVVYGTVSNVALYSDPPTVPSSLEYNETNHLYTAHLEVTGTNISNAPYHQTLSISGAAAYLQGKREGEAGSSRSVSSLSSITLSSSDTGTSTKNTTVTYTSGSNSTANISINASKVYQQGVNDGYTITASEISVGSFSVQTGSTSGRTSAGSISGQSVYNARNSGYLFFSVTCRGKTRNFYVSINA